MNALEHFKVWLPGEMVYAATKKGNEYHTRIERARRGTADRSMYAFLGYEWDQARLLAKQGAHHSESHQKTAQLQLAKFTNGLMDKAGAIKWIAEGSKPTKRAYASAALRTAEEIIKLEPWNHTPPSFTPELEIDKPFEKTVFRGGIIALQRNFVTSVDASTVKQQYELQDAVTNLAISLGGFAANCYVAYAERYLTPDQYALAPSQHA